MPHLKCKPISAQRSNMKLDLAAFPQPCPFEDLKPGELFVLDGAQATYFALKIDGLREPGMLILAQKGDSDPIHRVSYRSAIPGNVARVEGDFVAKPLSDGDGLFTVRGERDHGSLLVGDGDCAIVVKVGRQTGTYSLLSGVETDPKAHRVYPRWVMIRREGEKEQVFADFKPPRKPLPKISGGLPNSGAV